MHNHWFTLYNYWKTQSARLVRGKITQAFTYEKNQCSFTILRDGEQYRVDYSGHPELPYLVVKDQLNIPRKKVLVLEAVHNNPITAIRMIPGDRVLQWQMEDSTSLYFEFFGGNPNIYYTKKTGEIISAFKDPGGDRYGEFREFSGIPFPLPQHFSHKLQTMLDTHPQKSLKNALTQILPHWTGQLANETIYRAGIELELQVKDVPKSLREKLATTVNAMINEIIEPYVYISEHPEAEFSLLPLHHKPEFTWDIKSNIASGYGQFIGVYYRWKRYRTLYAKLRKSLGNKIERLERRKEKQQSDLWNWKSPGTYRKYGDLLMANLHSLDPGQSSVTVSDIMGNMDEIHIPLQPDLSIVENAQVYYEKAKKTARGKTALEKQISQTKSTLVRLKEQFRNLEKTTSLSSLEEIQDDLEKLGISVKSTQSPETAERLPYTEFISPDGWRILVGRSARDNDELTFHVANKDDFWFHAENVPGSHVIAVADNKHLDKPPKATIEYAASLAAGFSQAQHSNLVPVVYTKRKYVTKPRNAGPGAVRHQFEESVIVEPRKK